MYKTLLIAHIIFGTVSLLSGLAAVLSKKGFRVHRGSGKVFYLAMYGTTFCAVIMSLIKWNPFLLSIGIFATYLVFSGKQAIGFLRLTEPYTPRLRDRVPAVAGVGTAVCMLLYPLTLYSARHGWPVSVLQVFGAILLLFSIRDLRIMLNPANFTPRNAAWLPRHISGMGGAYISTVTAFLVVNVRFTPAWVVWLAPTVVGTIFISASIARLNVKQRKTV